MHPTGIDLTDIDPADLHPIGAPLNVLKVETVAAEPQLAKILGQKHLKQKPLAQKPLAQKRLKTKALNKEPLEMEAPKGEPLRITALFRVVVQATDRCLPPELIASLMIPSFLPSSIPTARIIL